ncbi:MAG: hypothetical protein SGBAC_009324 [Bacillariaceae sp.]
MVVLPSSEKVFDVDEMDVDTNCQPLDDPRPLSLLTLQNYSFNNRPENIAKTFGCDNLDTAQAYQSIVGLLVDSQKYEQALEVCEEILEIVSGLLGHDHLATAATYHTMGELMESKNANLTEAMGMYQAALQIRLKLLGNNDMDTVATHKILRNLKQNMMTESQ